MDISTTPKHQETKEFIAKLRNGEIRFKKPTIGAMRRVIELSNNAQDPTVLNEMIDLFVGLTYDPDELNAYIDNTPLDDLEPLFFELVNVVFGEIQKK